MNANDSATPNSREMAVLKENFPHVLRQMGPLILSGLRNF